MKILILTLWCLVPLGLVAYHLGPGQEQSSVDESSISLARAESHLSEEKWEQAIAELRAALDTLPADRVEESKRIRLEIAKARMQSGGLPTGREELDKLIEEMDAETDPDLYQETLEALAHARFHMVYLMKMEGRPETDWEPEIEAARQEWKLLHQQAVEAGDIDSAARHADDLESAIKLARMEPDELYGKKIPNQCKGCKSGKCNSPGKKPSNKENDSRGASSGAPVDGEGS